MKSLFLLSLLFLSWPAFTAPKYVTGLKAPFGWKRGAKFEHHPKAKAAAVLPEKFSLADKWGSRPPVRDQKRCGCCWAEATEGAVELAVFWQTGKVEPLSVQEILSCSGAGSCEGGYFTAHNYQKKKGQATENAFPFRSENGRDYRCKQGLKPVQKIKSWSYLGDENNPPTVDEIKNVLITGIPVPVVMYADDKFMEYQSGVFTSCSLGNANHMVLIVGWNDKMLDAQGNVVGGWIVRNSWGEVFGEKGYFNIKYGCSRIGEVASWIKLP